MPIHVTRRRSLAALGAASLLAVPAATSVGAQDAEDGGSVALADSVVEQIATLIVDISQNAEANAGYNVQVNSATQSNPTVQDSWASATGGEAWADTGEPRDTEAIATGGNGGEAIPFNDATSDNAAALSNSLEAGKANAVNNLEADIRQSQDNDSTNDADALGGAGAAVSLVIQDSYAEVVISQSAQANSGWNVQENTVDQSNDTDQISTGSADGGGATATTGGNGSVADALGGDGGTATAANTSSSSNTAGGGNSITTGDATAVNNATITVGQSSTSTSTNTVIVTEP